MADSFISQGEYAGFPVSINDNMLIIETGYSMGGLKNTGEKIELNLLDSVDSWLLISSKMAPPLKSIIGRSLLGGIVLGPWGAGIGALSSLKNRNRQVVQLFFKNGEKSIVIFSEQDFFKLNLVLSERKKNV